jgi:hypothetical protein
MVKPLDMQEIVRGNKRKRAYNRNRSFVTEVPVEELLITFLTLKL